MLTVAAVVTGPTDVARAAPYVDAAGADSVDARIRGAFVDLWKEKSSYGLHALHTASVEDLIDKCVH